MEDGGRVWNKCKERVELGTSGLMVSRVGNGCSFQYLCVLVDPSLIEEIVVYRMVVLLYLSLCKTLPGRHHAPRTMPTTSLRCFG